MRRLLAAVLVLAPALASAQAVSNRGMFVRDEGSNLGFARTLDMVGSTVSCGISGGVATCTFSAPSVTITHNSTATSGCTAGALFRSTSNLADCGAGLTYASGAFSVSGATGTTVAATINNGSSTGAMLKLQSAGVDVFSFNDPETAVSQLTSFWTLNGATGALTGTGQLGVNNAQIVSTGNNYGIAFSGGGYVTGNTTQTPDTTVLHTGALSNSFRLSEVADATYDFNNGPCGTSACTDPALIIHSRNQSTTEYIALQHNGTAAVISSPGPRLAALSSNTTLTEATATAFARVAVATGTVSGGDLLVTVEANDATDYQARTISVPWSAANKAGTLTLGLGTTSESVAASAGTLTCTITFVDSGSGNADLKADCTSSLTQTTLRANAQVRKNFGTGAITAQ